MSTAVATPSIGKQRFNLWETTVGKKAIMAVTGVILFGFVIGHLLGNLQVFLGREVLNHYAELLHAKPALLWVVRSVLIAAVGLHIVTAVQLALRKNQARPQAYVSKRHYQYASYASRTMYWSGPILLAFIVYHLLHFTVGAVHPEFSPTDVYSNVVIGFQRVPVSIAYIVAMLFLGLHLYHGVWSMFQSLGQARPQYTSTLKALAGVAAAFLTFGNIAIPVSILAGWVTL